MRMLIYDNSLDNMEVPPDTERKTLSMGDRVQVLVGDHGGRLLVVGGLELIKEMDEWGYYKGKWVGKRPPFYPTSHLPKIEVHYTNISQIKLKEDEKCLYGIAPNVTTNGKEAVAA